MSKLIHTPKTLGIIYQESDFLTQAPDHSLLYKLSKKRVHFFGIRAMEEASAIIKSLPSYAFFSREVSLLFIFSVFVKLSDTKLVAFLATRSYHEALASFYIRRGLDEERKRFIHFRAESSFEKGRYKLVAKLVNCYLQLQVFKFLFSTFQTKGLVSNWYARTSEVLLSSIRQRVEIVSSTQEYVDNCSSEVPLEVDLDNLRNILCLFFAFQFSILMVATVIQKRSLLFDLVTKIISQIKNLFALIIKLVLDINSLFAAFFLKIKRFGLKICYFFMQSSAN